MRGLACAAALLLVTACGGDKEKPAEAEGNASKTKTAQADPACASAQTYDRLKELLFDEAARIRGDDAVDLDRLSEASVVRMEDPVVRERDPELNVTMCEGTFVLELPPGSENAFDGERRLTAQVQYAAQTAADGSGLVYQLDRAEPIIYRLATVGGVGRAGNQAAPAPGPGDPAPRQAAPEQQAEARPAPAPAARPEQPPQRTAEARPPRQDPPAPRQTPPQARQPAPQAPRAAERPASASARPSFNCRHARARSERMVCGSGQLAALDRRMSSMFYSALADADPGTRAALRRSRDRFLTFRNRCSSEACVAQAYRDRMDEIADIAGRR